jgi:hypothetical protein
VLVFIHARERRRKREGNKGQILLPC